MSGNIWSGRGQWEGLTGYMGHLDLKKRGLSRLARGINEREKRKTCGVAEEQDFILCRGAREFEARRIVDEHDAQIGNGLQKYVIIGMQEVVSSCKQSMGPCLTCKCRQALAKFRMKEPRC